MDLHSFLTLIDLLDSFRRRGPSLEGEQEYKLSTWLLSSSAAWGRRGCNFFPVVFPLLRLLFLLLLRVRLNQYSGVHDTVA